MERHREGLVWCWFGRAAWNRKATSSFRLALQGSGRRGTERGVSFRKEASFCLGHFVQISHL